MGSHITVQLSTRPSRRHGGIRASHRQYGCVSSHKRRTFVRAKALRDTHQRWSTTWSIELCHWSGRAFGEEGNRKPECRSHSFNGLEKRGLEAQPRFGQQKTQSETLHAAKGKQKPTRK